MGLSPLSQPDSPVLAANVFFSSRVDDPACATLLGPDAFLCMTEEQLRSLPVDVETLWIRSRIAVSSPTLEFPHMSRLKKLLLGQETPAFAGGEGPGVAGVALHQRLRLLRR